MTATTHTGSPHPPHPPPGVAVSAAELRPGTGTPVLSIRDLHVDFTSADGVNRGVAGLDLDVAQGEILALVGETGSGKTVTAKAVLGLLPDQATARGQVYVLGHQVLGLGEAELRAVRGAQVAMVFQEPSTALNPVQTVGWQIREAIRAHRRVGRREARDRAVELLRLVDLPEPERRVGFYPHQLSGGQRQRVVIALALANQPRLLIADEPTTALDVTVQAEILHLLRDLRDRLGTSVLLITHNLGVVAELADRVVVLRNGTVVEDAAVEPLFAAPRADYTRQLIAAVPRLDRTPTPTQTSAEPEAAATGDLVLAMSDVVVEYPPVLGRRGPTRAVDGVDLEVRLGEVLGLVGESGSGKTTLGRVAVGLTAATQGRVELLGTDLGAATRSSVRTLRSRVGVVFQDPATSLDPRLSVEDSVAEPLLVHRAASGAALRARVAELLDQVQLPASFSRRRPDQLSGGQRQRVVLARALALRPTVLVADEPTSALDVSVQEAVLALFAQLQAELGFAALFISHDLAVVDQVCGRVVVLRAGKVVETGPAAQVLRSPSHPYTRGLIESAPVPDPLVQRARRARPPSAGSPHA